MCSSFRVSAARARAGSIVRVYLSRNAWTPAAVSGSFLPRVRFTSPTQVSETSSATAKSLLLGFLARHGSQPILRAKLNRERAFAVNLLRRFLHATHARFRVIGDQHQVLRYCYAGNDEVWLIDP